MSLSAFIEETWEQFAELCVLWVGVNDGLIYTCDNVTTAAVHALYFSAFVIVVFPYQKHKF